MSRDVLDRDGRDAFDEILQSRGHVAAPFRVLLHQPELARRVAALGELIRGSSSIPAGLREVAILTTAKERQCAYEWRYHVGVARTAGVSDHVVASIDSGQRTHMTVTESRVIDYVAGLCRNNQVSDVAYEQLRGLIGTAAMIELSAIVGYYSMLAAVLNAAGIDADD